MSYTIRTQGTLCSVVSGFAFTDARLVAFAVLAFRVTHLFTVCNSQVTFTTMTYEHVTHKQMTDRHNDT